MFFEVLNDIPARTQEWVWDRVIPAGQLTLVMGEPGVGKSLLAIDAMARVTRGEWGLSDGKPVEPGSVVLFSGEDDLRSVVRGRLDSAGADRRFVNVVEYDADPVLKPSESHRNLLHEDRVLGSLEAHLNRLSKQGTPCRLIVIDPVSCFVVAANGRNDGKARHVMTKLADLAAQWDTAILLVDKPSMVENGKRGRWSATTPVLAETSRSVWSIVCDPDEPGRRLLLPVKTNLCETPPGLAFTIQNRRICWEDESVAQTAEQYLAEANHQQRLQHVAAESELSRATEWLRVRLSDGKVYSNVLKSEAAENDFGEKTLRRALTLLGCRKGKEKKADGQWYWRLPTPILSAAAEMIPPIAKASLEPTADLDWRGKLAKS
jgi:KaiC/GvpD/RAD55 family RecA-like ATPase